MRSHGCGAVEAKMPVDRDKLLTEGQALLKKSQSVEEVLSYFRSQGANKIDCISILKRLTSISQGDAKRVVHFSAAWADVKEADDAFHEELGRQ
jgi:ribosomal protein L7/L12